MATYRVHVQRYIEETATIEIVAHSIEEAVEEAEGMVENSDDSIIWERGDDIIAGAAAHVGQPAYNASSTDEEETWERG